MQKFGPRINAFQQGNSSLGNTENDVDVAQRKVRIGQYFVNLLSGLFYHYVALSKFEFVVSESSFFIIVNFVALVRVKLI